MANFVINKDIPTSTPTIEVTLNAENALPLGTHRFQLVVVDETLNRSSAAVVEIVVIDTAVPTASLTVTNLDGGPIKVVPFSQAFKLDGSRSFDSGGGKITQYIWTYLGPRTG